MNTKEDPRLFYLFREEDDIVIRPMTKVEAEDLWNRGDRWVDVPQESVAHAQQLRFLLLKARLKRA